MRTTRDFVLTPSCVRTARKRASYHITCSADLRSYDRQAIMVREINENELHAGDKKHNKRMSV